MEKLIRFSNIDDYFEWTDRFENAFEYQEIPVVIDDGWKISMDLITYCKSYKTAIRRFAKAFMDVEQAEGWFEGIRETCDNGCFEDLNGWKVWGEDERETRKRGCYSWGVEEVDDGCWYVFLNISGCYADRDSRA